MSRVGPWGKASTPHPTGNAPRSTHFNVVDFDKRIFERFPIHIDHKSRKKKF